MAPRLQHRSGSLRTDPLSLFHSEYASDILEEFSMATCSPAPTPMSSKLAIDPLLDEPLDVNIFPFAFLLGKLLYYANMTRPDISACVSLLSRFINSPTSRHWEQAKRVLRYVSGTKDHCLYLLHSIHLSETPHSLMESIAAHVPVSSP